MTKTITTSDAWTKILGTNGQIFGAVTIKRTNGLKRTFNCRLSSTVNKGKNGVGLKFKPGEKNLIGVCEIAAKREDEDKFRFLNMDGLLEIAIAGERFMVRDDDKA